LPDEPFPLPVSLPVPVFIVPTAKVNPAEKRDIGLKYAKGDILAFIDDDAYPAKDWLKNAAINFKNEEVAAVGGPAVTPPNDTMRQKASGLIFSSYIVSGNFRYRYVPDKRREVNDFPSCNLLVRKSVMLELGGFDTALWPGEDTKLCLDITRKLGRKIIYDPEVLVYHHRRDIFMPHLSQIANYALHRGYFVKRYPQNSLKLAYFVPSVFLFFLIAGGLASSIFDSFRLLYLLAISYYLLLGLFFSVICGLRVAVPVFLGIILTHLCYGMYFLKGLFSLRLKEEKIA